MVAYDSGTLDDEISMPFATSIQAKRYVEDFCFGGVKQKWKQDLSPRQYYALKDTPFIVRGNQKLWRLDAEKEHNNLRKWINNHSSINTELNLVNFVQGKNHGGSKADLFIRLLKSLEKDSCSEVEQLLEPFISQASQGKLPL